MRRPHNRLPAASGALLSLTLLIVTSVQSADAQVEVTPPQEPEPIQATQVDVFTMEDADMVLNIQEVIDLALESSYSVYQLKQSYLSQSYGLEIARRRLKTRIDFSSTLPSISQGINPQFYFNPDTQSQTLDYLKQDSRNLSANLTVRQPLITDGDIRLTGGLRGNQSVREQTGTRPDIKNRSVQPSLGISFTQPLFQYNQIKSDLRNAELSFERLDRTYTQDELSRINSITNQFYTLFQQQRSLENTAESFRLSDINYQTGQRKFQAGLIAKVDRMRLEVTRANDMDKLENAKNSLESAQYAFNRTVGLPLETKVWVVAEQEYRPIEVDLDRALELAYANRAERRLQEIQLEQSEMSLRSTISASRPNLQMSAGYDITGTSTFGGLGYESSWSDHWNKAFDLDNASPNTNVSLSLTIPVFDWGQNAARIERAMASLESQRRGMDEAMEDLKRNVIDRVRAVESAQRRFEIQMANQTVADTTYEISRTRYDRGEITITELLAAQQQYNDTKSAYLSALITYERAKATLAEYTLWDWERDQPIARRTQPPTPFDRKRD